MTATAAGKAIGEAVAAAAGAVAADRAAAEGEQLGLFAVPVALTKPGETAEESAQRVAAIQAEAERRAGPGRPAGAVNRSTREWRDYILRRGGHPAVRMAEWAMLSPAALAAELGCTKLEAFDRLKALWAELNAVLGLPRLAPTDDKGQVVPWLNLMLGGSGAGGEAPGVAPWAYLDAVKVADPQPQQNQALSEGAEAMSHDGLSHGEPSA